MLIGVLFHVALLEPPAPGMPTVSPFEDLVDVSAAVFWLLFLLTGVSLFALRAIDRDLPRPFKVPGYPVIPLLFCGSCVFMIYGAVSSRPSSSPIANKVPSGENAGSQASKPVLSTTTLVGVEKVPLPV